MALRAPRSQLALVDVGVAILAALSNIGEYRFDVTFSARDRCVHTSQWILCLVVIEFRDSADRSPCIRCVAILAGYV